MCAKLYRELHKFWLDIWNAFYARRYLDDTWDYMETLLFQADYSRIAIVEIVYCTAGHVWMESKGLLLSTSGPEAFQTKMGRNDSVIGEAYWSSKWKDENIYMSEIKATDQVVYSRVGRILLPAECLNSFMSTLRSL